MLSPNPNAFSMLFFDDRRRNSVAKAVSGTTPHSDFPFDLRRGPTAVVLLVVDQPAGGLAEPLRFLLPLSRRQLMGSL